jgi:anaerobic selenocysteine-containing dehydrogenase
VCIDDGSQNVQSDTETSGVPTTSRRDFVKTGATLTGALMLGGGYISPRMQSVDLAVVTKPSAKPKKKKKKDK